MPNISHPNSSISNTAKYLQIFIIVILLLYFGKTLFVPLLFGLLVAIVAFPTCKWLESKKWPRSLAIGLLLSILILLFFALVWLLGYEINMFIDDIPLIRNKVVQFSAELSAWLENNFGLQKEAQDSLLQKLTSNTDQGINGYMSNAFTTTVTSIFTLVLVPIYAALFLYHRSTFVKFLESITADKYKDKLAKIIHESIFTYFRFVKGTFFVYCIVGTLNSIGLLLLGINHAILFGMITAFMTAIPYVGIIISAALPISVALITKDSIWYAVGVVMVFTFVQYLEANVIFPRVVGQQLNLSTWAVLVSIIVGTLLWGIAGMILFIPFAAILKIISDNIEELKPVNILLNRDEGFKNGNS